MSPRKSPRRLSAAKGRELEVTAALAREAVARFHVSSAIALIDLAAARVAPERMLDIYVRVQGIRGSEAEMLSYSVLAALGRQAPKGVSTTPASGAEPAMAERASVLAMLKTRLKGRVHHDLRRWVELATGAAQASIIDIHARYAATFAQELAESRSVSQAVELYVEMAGVPARLEEMLYITLLDRLAEEELPNRKPDRSPREGGVTVLGPRQRRAV